MLVANDLYMADEYYMEAVRLDPLQATYRADLAQIYASAGLNQQDQILIDKAYYQVEKASNLKPYDPVIASIVINVYQLLGEKEKAIAKAGELLEINPLNIVNYELVMDLNLVQALDMLALTQRERAQGRADAIMQAGAMLEENIARLAKQYPAGPIYWQGRRLVYTGQAALRVAQARMIQGGISISKEVFLELVTGRLGAEETAEETKEEALIWLVAAGYLENDQETAAELLEMITLEDKKEHIIEEAFLLAKLLITEEVNYERRNTQ